MLLRVILIVALAGAVAAFACMGMRARHRRLGLARAAHQMNLRFASRDPLELISRYSGFVLPSAGHSPRAQNVIFGRYKGWNLRAFDYHCELGHGSRRLGRDYSVIVADTDLDVPPALMWHEGDTDFAPLAVRRPIGQVGRWLVIAGADFARALAEAFEGFAAEPVDIQTLGGSVMLGCRTRWRPADVPARLAAAAEGLAELRRRLKGEPPDPGRGGSVAGPGRL